MKAFHRSYKLEFITSTNSSFYIYKLEFLQPKKRIDDVESNVMMKLHRQYCMVPIEALRYHLWKRFDTTYGSASISAMEALR